MSNISPRQFGAQNLPGVQNKSTMPPAPTLQKSLNPGPSIGTLGTRPVPMPTKPPGGSFGRVGPTPVPMPTKPPGMKGMIGGTNRSVPMPTKPPSGGFSQGRMFNP
jgi:hypothetical protein